MGISGCRWSWPFRPAVLESGLSPVEMKTYAEALDAYEEKSYALASQRFAAIREQTSNRITARMALYGLACSRLMLAATPKDYQDAVALWETWVQCAPTKQERENPVLLAPVLKNKMIFSLIPFSGDEVSKEEQENSRWLMLKANNELQRMDNQLDIARQGIENRDKKIKTLESEIVRLNQQIKAFETIDQKIQNKKNSIPSAD